MKEIVQDGHPVLRMVAPPVPETMFNTKELDDIIKDMADALDGERDGVAIAAPQIGVSYRIFFVRYDRVIERPEGVPLEGPEVGVYINPEFVKCARRREEMEEGCLSVRGIYGHTYRHQRASVRARLPNGQTFERGAGGLLAQVFQHEIDHLDGVLFIDHALDTFMTRRRPDGRLEAVPEDEAAHD